MAQHRYHIHVCLVKNEQPDFENAWQIASTNDYFLTWDLVNMSTPYLNYSRQQIERCDCVLFVLADSYGQLSPSGVSFLHLCYIFATTKRKPMFALIKQPAEYHERRRADFAELLEKDQKENFAHYHTVADAIKAVLAGLHQLKPYYSTAGWIPKLSTASTSHKKSAKTHDSLVSAQLTPAILSDVTPSGETGLFKSSKSTPNKKATTTAKAALTPSLPVNIAAITPMNSIPATDMATMSMPVIPILPSETLVVSDTIMVSYSAHAYQDGNLSDLMLTHSFSWQAIINALKTLPAVFSNETILKKFNELLSQNALNEALQVMPNAHAVSRCQINTLDFHWVKKQLVNHHFLLKAHDERGTRELWQLNPQVK